MVGEANAKDLILTARSIKSPEAKDLGLINGFLDEPEGGLTLATRMAALIGQNGPIGVRSAKKGLLFPLLKLSHLSSY